MYIRHPEEPEDCEIEEAVRKIKSKHKHDKNLMSEISEQACKKKGETDNEPI